MICIFWVLCALAINRWGNFQRKYLYPLRFGKNGKPSCKIQTTNYSFCNVSVIFVRGIWAWICTFFAKFLEKRDMIDANQHRCFILKIKVIVVFILERKHSSLWFQDVLVWWNCMTSVPKFAMLPQPKNHKIH